MDIDYTEAALGMVRAVFEQMQALARCGIPALHPAAPHGMIHTSIPPLKREQRESQSAFLLMKKYSHRYFFSPLKSLCVLCEMPVSCIPSGNLKPLFFKISVHRSRCRELMYMEVNKSIALKNPPSQVKMLQRAQRRNGITALPEARVIFFQNLL